MTEKPGLDSQKDIEDFFWESAVILRTSMDAGNYKDYVFPLLFLKFLNDEFLEERSRIYDRFGTEKACDDPELYQGCYLPEEARWSRIRETSVDVGMRIADAMEAVTDSNPEMQGVFGDANWTNKERLPDELLCKLVEHMSTHDLSRRSFSGDELGIGYEYLLGKFADDSGHTAQEFFTNRTLIRVMVECLDPKEGDDVYDPTCGSAGMFVVCHRYLMDHKENYYTVRYYGQESNPITAAIGRMNLYIHDIRESEIHVGDTLKNPYFHKGSELTTFDMVLANPPYSIKKWDRKAIEKDVYGRNFLGVPPQSCADYVFIQHILKSMDPETGRCAILLPHGILFRDFEDEIRRNLVESDLVECIIGVAPGLFYNSPMEACVMICRSRKPEKLRGKIRFIDAKKEFIKNGNHSDVSDENRKHIIEAYRSDQDIDHFSRIVDISEIKSNGYKLKIPLYVDASSSEEYIPDIKECANKWIDDTAQLKECEEDLMDSLHDRGH